MATTFQSAVERPRSIAGRARDRVLYPIRKDRELLAVAESLAGAVALEPGGGSAVFTQRGLVPVYQHMATLDILDFAERTIWAEHAPSEIAPRRHLIAEASDLADIPTASYDLVLSSHVLEHIANPIGALEEWRRVVRPGGHVLMVVPHRDNTFDHRRPITTIEHMREDASRKTSESDLTHLEESLRLHDLRRDRGTKTRQAFEQRSRQNPTTRSLHHHVFVTRSVVEACRASGLEVLLVKPKPPYHIVCLCRVPADGIPTLGLDESRLTEILRCSPFPSDREHSVGPSPGSRDST